MNNTGRKLLIIIFLLECFALPTQLYLIIAGGKLTVTESIVRFFSFFTILTNTLVAICSVYLLFTNNQFFRKTSTLTAITVYILIVGLVFNIILRPLQKLEGLHRIDTEIFHTIVPLLFLFYWVRFVPKENLSWKKIPAWLVYPLLYMVYTLIHGNYSDFYPYPFVDVNKLGLNIALRNGFFIMLAFVFFSILFIAVGNLQARRINNPS